MLAISMMLYAVASTPPADAVSAWHASANPLVLFAAAVAWAAIWAQVVVNPFYGKPESLYKEYHSNGKLNAVVSAIEANRLIPALAEMFNRALEAKTDRRTKTDKVAIEQLLQEVQFLPDLQAAQDAMSDISKLKAAYGVLRGRGKWLWQWGLAHVLSTLAMTAVYAYLYSFYDWAQWLLWSVVGVWTITLLAILWQLNRFSKLMNSFISDLELHGGD